MVVQRGSRAETETEDGREKEIAESPTTSARHFSTKPSTSAAAAVPVASTTVPATEVDSHVKREETVSAAVGCTESVESARGQVCVVITKGKITFTGDVETMVPLQPQFQQVLKCLYTIKDEEPAKDIRARVEAEIEERDAAASDATQAQHDEPKERLDGLPCDAATLPPRPSLYGRFPPVSEQLVPLAKKKRNL